MATTAITEANGADGPIRSNNPFAVREVLVSNIRPEDGLARKRDREGHEELQRSISQFGVLTPITVRRAHDDPEEYLLIKGQGRTLACRLLGIKTIPSIIVDEQYAETEKVQQFLVENVARLKMRPIDRALLIHRARADGEETIDIAERFGLAPATVRRLYAQMEGASQSEVAALRAGDVNLARHAAIARHIAQEDRPGVIDAVAHSSIRTKDLEVLFAALGWRDLARMGPALRSQRLMLLSWACGVLDGQRNSSTKDRLRELADRFPLNIDIHGIDRSAASR